MGKIYLNESFDFRNIKDFDTDDDALSDVESCVLDDAARTILAEVQEAYPESTMEFHGNGQDSTLQISIKWPGYSPIYCYDENLAVPPYGSRYFRHVETTLGLVQESAAKNHWPGRITVFMPNTSVGRAYCISPNMSKSEKAEWAYYISGDEFDHVAPRVDSGLLIFYRCHFKNFYAVVKTLLNIMEACPFKPSIKTKNSTCGNHAIPRGLGGMHRDDGSFGRMFSKLAGMDKKALAMVYERITVDISIEDLREIVNECEKQLKHEQKLQQQQKWGKPIHEGFDFNYGNSDDFEDDDEQNTVEDLKKLLIADAAEWLSQLWMKKILTQIKFSNNHMYDSSFVQINEPENINWWISNISNSKIVGGKIELDIKVAIFNLNGENWNAFQQISAPAKIDMPDCFLTLLFYNVKAGGYKLTTIKNLTPFGNIVETCDQLEIKYVCTEDLQGAPSVKTALHIANSNIRAPFANIKWQGEKPDVVISMKKGLPGPSSWRGLPTKLGTLQIQFTNDGIYYGTDSAVNDIHYELGSLRDFPVNLAAEHINIVPKTASKTARDSMKTCILYACRMVWTNEAMAKKMFNKLTKAYEGYQM